MPHPPYFGTGWEKMVEVPAPPCNVLSVAKTANLGPVEYGLHAATDTARRFGLLGPDRLEHRHGQGRFDCRNRQVTQRRIGIRSKRLAPQLCLLGITPTGLAGGDELFGAVPERGSAGFKAPCRRALSVPSSDRVEALKTLSTGLA